MPLLSFEGIDGSGKSTQIKLLTEWLTNKGKTPLIFREPGGTAVSEAIRTLLLDKTQHINPIAELLLFSAARSQLLSEKIIPSLRNGEWVILDRFFDSTTAYQGYGRGVLPLEQVQQLNRLTTNNIAPDITFYLDIDFETSIDRRKNAENDRMEASGADFYKKIITGYRQLAIQEDRIIRIDAIKGETEIHNEIVVLIEKNFNFLDL